MSPVQRFGIVILYIYSASLFYCKPDSGELKSVVGKIIERHINALRLITYIISYCFTHTRKPSLKIVFSALLTKKSCSLKWFHAQSKNGADGWKDILLYCYTTRPLIDTYV